MNQASVQDLSVMDDVKDVMDSQVDDSQDDVSFDSQDLDEKDEPVEDAKDEDDNGEEPAPNFEEDEQPPNFLLQKILVFVC